MCNGKRGAFLPLKTRKALENYGLFVSGCKIVAQLCERRAIRCVNRGKNEEKVHTVLFDNSELDYLGSLSVII